MADRLGRRSRQGTAAGLKDLPAAGRLAPRYNGAEENATGGGRE
jgi:hypothetical protein